MRESTVVSTERVTKEIELQPAALIRGGVFAVLVVHVLNIVVHLAHGFTPAPREWWLDLFDVDSEANVPTWLWSGLLLTCALSAWLMAARMRSSSLKQRRGFMVIAALLAIVSADEFIALHERCAAVLLDGLDARGITRLWVWALGAVLVAGLAATLIPFLRALESRQLRSGLFISAVVYIVGALGFEVLGQHYAATHGWSDRIYFTLSAIEELLEMCGPLLFLYSIERWKEEAELAEEYREDDFEVVDHRRIHSVISHSKRIPIAGNRWWDGDNTFLDLFPGPKGKSGQVITFVTECDLVVLGPSFRDALALYVEALEKGDWVFSEKKGHVVPKKDKPAEYPNRADQFATYARKKRQEPQRNKKRIGAVRLAKPF